MSYQPTDPPLTAQQAAAELGISIAALWKGVAAGRLPAPVYPMSRAPRWFRSELRAALEAQRMTPVEAMSIRRAAKLARVAA